MNDQLQPWTPDLYGYPLVAKVQDAELGATVAVTNHTQRLFTEMRARCENKPLMITVAPYDYPAALAYFAAHPREIREAVTDWAHPFNYLFRSAAPDGVTFIGTEAMNSYGNLTAIKQGSSTYDDWLAVEIRGDARLPAENFFVGLACLPVWADYMARLDQHWVEVADRLANLKSSYKPVGFGDWVLPIQRRRLYQAGLGYKYEADDRCRAELGIGISDLSRKSADALDTEWKAHPVWSAR